MRSTVLEQARDDEPRQTTEPPTSNTADLTSPQRKSGLAEMGQFVRFGLVGGSGVVVNMVVDYLVHAMHGGYAGAYQPLFQVAFLNKAFRFHHLSFVLAFMVANTTNFIANRMWTFKTRGLKHWAHEFWPFFLIGAAAAVAGIWLKSAMMSPDNVLYLPSRFFSDATQWNARALWAQLLAIFLTLPINFLLNKVWTFRAAHSLVR